MSKPANVPRLLLVEDTPSLQMLYRTVLTKAGYPPVCASSAAEALETFARIRPAIVLLDLMLPDQDGLSVMTEILAQAPETRVIVITANGSVNKAVEATRKGAHDFLVKPLGDIRLVGAVASAVADYRNATQSPRAQSASSATPGLTEFVAHSAAMQKPMELMKALAGSMAPVVIIGADGTGKKTCARMIHGLSPRARKPFVELDLAGLDKSCAEAALFGTGPSSHSGSAMGAHGALRKAYGGTLLIRALETLPQELQARLVSILNSGFLPVPNAEALPIDVRIITAMPHDPLRDVQAGLLRKDLYLRLVVLPLILPPLQDRREDIPDLAQRFLIELAALEKKGFERLEPAAITELQNQSWDGNLHELRNMLHRSVVLHDGPVLTPAMLPEIAHEAHGEAQADTDSPRDLETALEGMTLAEIEAYAIQAAITRHGGSIPRASQELDIAPSTIYRKRDAWHGKTH